jgi:hypothetical protein
MTNTTPLTGQPLEQPVPAPLRILAVFDKDQPCTEHHAPYTGTIPCTGDLRCSLCGTEWHPETGRLLRLSAGQPPSVLFGEGTPVSFRQGDEAGTILTGSIVRAPWGREGTTPMVSIVTDEERPRRFVRLITGVTVIRRLTS